MVYTIATNPSLDYTVETDLVPGQINRSRGEYIVPGGKGINVALMLQRLGRNSKVVGFAAGHTGRTIRSMLDEMGCCHEFLEPVQRGESRINVKIPGDPETSINGMGPVLTDEDRDRLLKLLEGVTPDDCVVISGWTRHIQFYEKLLERAHAVGCTTVLDTSGEALWQCLKQRPFLIKPNIHELGELFGFEDLEDVEAVQLAARLQEEGARNVLVSMGRRGAFLLTEDHRLYNANAVVRHKISSVGAGDSVIAGFLVGLRETKDFPRALRLGVAAGCATVYNEWLASAEEVLAMVDNITVEELEL